MARGDRNAERIERADMRRIAAGLLAYAKRLPPFDIANPKLMEERCDLCFETCGEMGLVPTYGAMAMFLGTAIDVLLKVRNGELMGWNRMRLTQESATVLQKNLEVLEAVFDVNFENGSYAQPVTGIFASKNLYGWKDVRETHELVATVEITPDQISERYKLAMPMHRSPDGAFRRLQDGQSAEAAAKTAAALNLRVLNGDFPRFSGELDSPLMGENSGE